VAGVILEAAMLAVACPFRGLRSTRRSRERLETRQVGVVGGRGFETRAFGVLLNRR